MPEPVAKGYFGEGYFGEAGEKDNNDVRTRLPHLIVMDPPLHPRPPSGDLPDHWRQFVRLDGSLYFYNPFLRLVTTEDIHKPRLRTVVENTARQLAKIAEANYIELPSDWELCVEIELEHREEVLHYNYITHEDGQYFQLGRGQLVCAERSLYWDHVEKYCMHHAEIPPFAEGDFLSEMAYGATGENIPTFLVSVVSLIDSRIWRVRDGSERILDNKGTTFRFTGSQTQALIGTYRELKEAQHEGISIAPALIWLFARTMKLVEETRTNSKYGTPEAAAARKGTWKDPSLKFRIIDAVLSLMFSGTHNMYRRRLMKTKFNNVLYLPDFRELLSDLIIEWGDSNLLTQYMNHGIIFGDRGSVTVLACFLALPIASLLWSFYAFTAALTAFCVQSVDVNHPVLTFMLFVSCLSGLTTVSFFWNIWVGWKFSKMVEYSEGDKRPRARLLSANADGSDAGMSSSKLSVASVRGSIKELLADATGEKRRNFVETIELQIGLKNYDPQRDKRFSGTVKLPNVPRPRMSICILADAADIDRAKQIDLEYMSVDDLKKLNKNKKLVKKLAKKYDAFLASETLIKQIPRLLGPGLSKAGKFPTPVSHAEDLGNKLTEVRSTIKFQLKKVLCLGVAVGHIQMTDDQVLANVMLSINFLVSLLKKNWQNVKSLHIKSTMGKPIRLF
ncbi:hypothetical protein EUX98_g3104 [Antrodiella citrinella]|uniref:Ribosomal protein n=1 Tax=Antrodiella citrinella TaxID=2447956 RepID=A0A4S4MXE1_9APHY|nr:hypothetical protein EUX98_g3104 [Antrodiella citrinella]